MSLRVAMLTSWNERCGVADYSRELIRALGPEVGVEVVPAPMRPARRSVYRAMGLGLNAGDVAHVQFTYAFFGGRHPLRTGLPACLGVVRKPLIVTLHELDATGGGPAGLYKRHFARRWLLSSRVRTLVTHSTAMHAELKSLGVEPGRIICCPMPVPPPPAGVRPDRFRRAHGLEGRVALTMLGFITRRKGYDVALAALRRLPSDFVLVVAGGEHPSDRSGTSEWLEREVDRLCLRDRVRLTGYLDVPDMEAAAAAADVILAPFHSMSASASLAFAISRERVIVASDLPQNAGLDCVRTFPRGDDAALAAAVQEVWTGSAEKSRLIQHCREYAARHSYAALAARMREAYAELVAAG